MPGLSNGSVSKSSSIHSTINLYLHPMEQRIKQLEIKILNYETKINLLNKKSKKIDEIEQRINKIISYNDKDRLTSCVKNITTLQKQFNLTKKSKVLNTILDIFERIHEIQRAITDTDSDED